MAQFLKRTVIGLAIGTFFVWLSLGQWPFDRLGGEVTFQDGHLVVGNASVPTASSSTIATEPETHGWVFDLGWLWPYLLILTFIHLLRVARFKPLLDPVVKLDWWTHNRIGAVGFMAMFLFPLRLGEFVRPYLVKKNTQGKARMSAVMATVVVERIADGLMVSLLLCVVLFFVPKTNPDAEQLMIIGALASLGLFVSATGFLAVAVWQKERAIRIVRATVGRVMPRFAHRILDIMEAFLRGLKNLPSRGAFLWFVFLTVVYWLINGVGVWVMVKGFYLPIDLIGAYAMMATVVCGMMIPNSPGNVGSFWVFLLIPAALYGVTNDSTQAIACGLMIWLLQLVQQTAFGAYFVLRGKVSIRRVIEATANDDAHLNPQAEPAKS